jgi:cell division inhibitor SulA
MVALSAPASVSKPAMLKPVLWINPPFEPQAVALAQYGLEPAQHWLSRNLNATDALWAVEQSLRSGACVLVLSWLSGIDMPSLRRLKLAALSGACVGVLFRPQREAAQTTAANLRLRLNAMPEGLQVELLKVQGRRPCSVLLQSGQCSEWRFGNK